MGSPEEGCAVCALGMVWDRLGSSSGLTGKEAAVIQPGRLPGRLEARGKEAQPVCNASCRSDALHRAKT